MAALGTDKAIPPSPKDDEMAPIAARPDKNKSKSAEEGDNDGWKSSTEGDIMVQQSKWRMALPLRRSMYQ